ncbi:MAG: immunoglobulin domain-containing protein, partial [Rhodoferax sp.]|nr:immunoglobulin domain-containing protein [Rhodoferax sp.]
MFSKPIAALAACFTAIALTACGGGSSSNHDGGGSAQIAIPTPTISIQPASQTVDAGNTATFSVTATGSAAGGALAYQWKKDGADISGATDSSYTTPTTSKADNGKLYSVAVSNSGGTVASNDATLTVTDTAAVTGAPSITTQPATLSVVAGQSATFTVAATGSEAGGALSYQWKKNGNNIADATSSSYTTPATSVA